MFTRRLEQLAGQAASSVLASIQKDLLEDPQRGVLVPGLGGIRKARAPHPLRRKGRRGGFRYFYLYVGSREHIHLLYLLSKGQQEDLSTAERANLREMVELIKAGGNRGIWRGQKE